MAAPELDAVTLEVRERVCWITLNRPEALNAWTPQLGADLRLALQWAGDATEVRAVVIAGAGRAFSAGADLKLLAADAGEVDLGTPLRDIFHPAILAVRTLEKPVVAAVGGAAAGIGCSLALATDLIVAAESAYFLFAFAGIGLALDGGASLLLAARVGYGRASEMALLGGRVPATQALNWGLVNRVVPDGELLEATALLAARLAAGSPGALAAIKRELNAAVLGGLEAALEREAALQQERGGSADFIEGAAAFLEKRPPTFGGEPPSRPRSL
jgi:2-(1,2-epoxy-1,2-dihydrophenyl)acetyl-CoA isomerase